MRHASESDLGALFLKQARKYLGTDFPTKLRCAVEVLPAGALWSRPNAASNSVGNLLMHLTGNVRQWIVSGVGGAPDIRHRALEFSAREGPSAADLLGELERTLAEADAVLAALTAESLLERRIIQGRDLTVFQAVLGVVEHFAEHLGQIIWVAKDKAPGQIRFYDDAGGLARPLWESRVRPLTGRE